MLPLLVSHQGRIQKCLRGEVQTYTKQNLLDLNFHNQSILNLKYDRGSPPDPPAGSATAHNLIYMYMYIWQVQEMLNININTIAINRK